MDTEPVTVEEVQRLATILCLDVPQGTEFGVDFHQWNVGPKFKGVKMIPPGIHFVYYKYASHEIVVIVASKGLYWRFNGFFVVPSN
jgi:A1 cistron-splicing factor AAR2